MPDAQYRFFLGGRGKHKPNSWGGGVCKFKSNRCFVFRGVCVHNNIRHAKYLKRPVIPKYDDVQKQLQVINHDMLANYLSKHRMDTKMYAIAIKR